MSLNFKSALARLAVATLSLSPCVSCGVNMYQSGESKDPAEDAVLALERGDESEAISILESALADDEGNPQYLSILATAYAQRAGVEPLDFAQRMSENNSSSSSTSDATDTDEAAATSSANSFTQLYAVMPAATDEVIADVDKAVDILLVEIATEDRLPGDTFKLALYQTASVVLRTKALDKNGDGKLSPDEILDLSSTSASGILNQLAQAATLLGAAGTDDQTMQKAASQISKYQTQIDAAEGATAEEKLKNYLAASNAAATP